MFTVVVGAIQRLPVQSNLLDKNKTPIKDVTFPSNRDMFITEVKGHYLRLLMHLIPSNANFNITSSYSK
jgi:hypothetical protein